MPKAHYDPYGIFPSPKPNRRLRYHPLESVNRFDEIGGDSESRKCRMMEFLWTVDTAVTDYFAGMANELDQAGGLFRTIAKVLELSMHGLLWLGGIVLTSFLTDSRVAAHLLVNLFFALLLDLLVVCVLKLTFRRARPHHNRGNMIAEAPYVDQFSFPSGHSSRAAMLTKLLITLTVMDAKTKILVCFFPVCLGISRIMLGRHYFSDVLAGLLIGLVECDVAVFYWLPPDTCHKFWRFMRQLRQGPMVLDAASMHEEEAQKSLEIQLVSSSSELIQNVYNVLERAADSCRRAKRSQIVIGLSGGSLIKTLADVLPCLNEEYLKDVRFVFCDERRVPFDDPESTYGQYMKMIFPSLQRAVSKEQFICINPDLPPEECATDYEQKLRSLLGTSDEWPSIDVLLLGMGPDGHTCSLFPGHPVLKEQRRWVAPVRDSPKPPPERVTLTLPVLSHARRVVFIATGSAKADVVKQILEGSAEEKGSLPPAMIKPARRCGQIYWILDKDAAGKLSTASSS